MIVIVHTKTDQHYIIDDADEIEVRTAAIEGRQLEDGDGFRFKEVEE